MEVDFDTKLQITIRNKSPVGLTDLTLALLAVDHQFQRFLESEANQDYQPSTELYIKEVSSGSIIVDLVAHAMPIVPLIWEGGPLSQWVKQAQAILEWLTGKIETKPKILTKKDFSQWHSILEPVAKDNGSQLNLTVSDGGRVINQFFITSHDAMAAQNRITREIAGLEESDDHILKNRVMTWYQAKFDTISDTGNKAIIESISKKPVKVIFENRAVRESILAGDRDFDKPWHELAYLVDVEVQTINGVPRLYNILSYHEEDTFDPEEQS